MAARSAALKHDLKEWERTFQRLHGRKPSKDDIRASHSIYALYKDYARIKAGKSSRSCRTTQSSITGNAFKGLAFRPTKYPSSIHGGKSSSSCSDGSHISATPPRKRLRCGRSTHSEILDVSRPIFADISANTKFYEDSDNRRATCNQLYSQDIEKSSKKETSNDVTTELTSKLSFNIKMQQIGKNGKENVGSERSCFVNSIKFSLQRSECLSRRVLASTLMAEKVTCANVIEFGSVGTLSACDALKGIPNEASLVSSGAIKHQDDTSNNFKAVNLPGGALFSIGCNVSMSNDMLSEPPKCHQEDHVIRLSKLTIVEIKKLLEEKGLSLSGNKAILLSRLAHALFEQNDLTAAGNTSGIQRVATAEAPSTLLPVIVSKGEHLPHRVEIDKDGSAQGTFTESYRCKANNEESLQLIEVPGKLRPQRTYKERSRGTGKDLSKVTPPKPASLNLHSRRHSQNSHANGNFVKLNLGKKCGGSHRFMNYAFKRKARAARCKYGRRKQSLSTSMVKEDEIDYCGEDFHYEAAGQLLSPFPFAPDITEEGRANQLTSMPSVSLLAEVCENPTQLNLLHILHLYFGHKEFRPGQVETIQRILSGQSTMLVLPTGFGKSLCYQVPALLLPGLTVVISPLVSLMMDQLHHLPAFLPGAILRHNAQAFNDYPSVLKRLNSGELKVLFASPERFLCDKFMSLLDAISPISLVVIDEAHCMSEWSHNFRPSYFRLGGILREKLKLTCSMLAMTATATRKTLSSVMHSLQIPSSGLVEICSVRENIFYTASQTDNRCTDLLSLLNSKPFQEARSIIIYCNFQLEADNISLILRDNGFGAMSYHAGMDLTERKHIQELFCSNKVKVVAATVAFGLGIDKGDIDAVIHYGFPSSLEQYLQETGRAGRNGDPAHCHIFMNNHNFLKLRSLAYTNSVNEDAIKRFLCKVFCHFSSQSEISSLIVESSMKDLDLKEEVMATVLSCLDIGDTRYVSLLPQIKTTCSLQFHKNSPSFLAKRNMLVDAILKRSHEKHGGFQFNMPSVANLMGLKLSDVLQQLQDLQVAGEVSFILKDPAFCFYVLRVPDDVDVLASNIVAQLSMMEDLKVRKLDLMFKTATAMVQRSDMEFSKAPLREAIRDYFQSTQELPHGDIPHIVKTKSFFLKADIKVFLKLNPSISFTSMAVAKILHGIPSPAYPASVWSKNHFWARYFDVDFNLIKDAVLAELQLTPKNEPLRMD